MPRVQSSSAASDRNLQTSDITTNNVTSTKHGFAPKSPANAAQFLNGAATPAYAAVTDANLSVSDITTNDGTSSQHGFLPKTWSAAWVSWTPTWTNLTIGNATVTGAYIQHGKEVIARLFVKFGTTTSVSGDTSFSLPVTAVNYGTGAGNLVNIGTASLFDNNLTINQAYVTWASTTTASIRVMDASATYVKNANFSSTIPFTWATNYTIGLTIAFEAS